MQPKLKTQNTRIGIDIGGTFTDFVIYNPQEDRLWSFKVPSTPEDPSKAVVSGLNKIGLLSNLEKSDHTQTASLLGQRISIIHGSTVATNALLEHKGEKTALFTTEGFRDVIQIGRQNRPHLYDFFAQPSSPLVPEDRRFEIKERVNHLGEVITPLDETQVPGLIKHLQKDQRDPITSIAVVFLFSFANPSHEAYVAKLLREAGFFVSASYEILPEYREFERTSTTVVNAYVTPVLERYLLKLENYLSTQNHNSIPTLDDPSESCINTKKITLQVMQSNGGCISLSEAKQYGVHCILSGPAGGIIGSLFVAQEVYTAEYRGEIINSSPPLRLLTFDMGGTSTDVSVIIGKPSITSDIKVGGYPIRVPVLDIHTIGAGGGSIAYKDMGGILRVGPESAGADPGPACYGKSLRLEQSIPTVTDANLLLGRIPADHFLGGEMKLLPDRSLQAITRLGEKLNLDPIQTALGIIEIANAHMERALRVISVERGYDPRDFTLLSFGGAGGLHAVELARRMGIRQVLVPPFASVLSAYGMLSADVIKDYSQTVMFSADTPMTQIQEKFSRMSVQGYQDILKEGFGRSNIQLEELIDLRYKGQSYELTIPFGPDFADRFHQEHQKTFGYKQLEIPIEIVNLRVRATGLVIPPHRNPKPLKEKNPNHAVFDNRQVIFSTEWIDTTFFHGEALQPGNQVLGPAIIVREDTTILIGLDDEARVDCYDNLVITVSPEKIN